MEPVMPRTDCLLTGPCAFRRHLPFGECTERTVVVGDHHGDTRGDRKLRIIERYFVPTLSGVHAWSLPTWSLPIRRVRIRRLPIRRVLAWVGAVLRVGVRIGRATHALVASSGNYPFPRIQRVFRGLSPQ